MELNECIERTISRARIFAALMEPAFASFFTSLLALASSRSISTKKGRKKDKGKEEGERRVSLAISLFMRLASLFTFLLHSLA